MKTVMKHKIKYLLKTNIFFHKIGPGWEEGGGREVWGG